MPTISAFRRLRQDCQPFMTNLSYRAKSQVSYLVAIKQDLVLKKKKTQNKTQNKQKFAHNIVKLQTVI